MLSKRAKPIRGDMDEAALELVARHGPQILATARRYAATPEDGEDAYQRGLEILLTKAPTTNEEELVPWLKTVVKHEAFALRRQRDRHSPVTDDGELSDRPTPAALTPDQAERLEHLRQGAEALRQLKPQEIRALLLRAEGYSYAEIGEITGWTYTKVNRCLTEGRQALAVRLAGIQGGIECAKLAPALSALVDGEAKAEELALLRPHMKTCLSCRARLREFREAAERVAALLPAPALADGGGGEGVRGLVEAAIGGVQQKAEGVLAASQHKAAALGERAHAAAQHKAAAFGERAHAAAELVSAQKLAVLAAGAAALAGGGTAAVDQFANHRGPPLPRAAQQVEAKPVAEQAPAEPAPQPAPVPLHEQPTPTTPTPPPAPAPPPPQPAPPPPPPPPPPNPANEFTPTNGSGAPLAATSSEPAPSGAPPAPAPQPAPVAKGGGGPGEFAP